MKAWLMDVYRVKNHLVCWLKTPNEDVRIIQQHITHLYLADEPLARKYLDFKKIPYRSINAKTWSSKKRVLQVAVPELSLFERFVKDIEEGVQHRVPLFNADVTPEQSFLFKNDLTPCSLVEYQDGKLYPSSVEASLNPIRIDITVIPFADIKTQNNTPIKSLIVDGEEWRGAEVELLTRFIDYYAKKDADVVLMPYAFSRLPYLASRLDAHKLDCPLHRWDAIPIKYKGGRSFWRYNMVTYQDFAVRLRGRWLIDTTSFVGSECDLQAIIEMIKLSGNLPQQVASRSPGAVFQSRLVKLMAQEGYLIAYKEKPMDEPMTMHDMVKSDRAGHTMDPQLGFHQDVAEIDFSSMFPWLIYNHNISAETILDKQGPHAGVPGVPIKISMRKKGLTPRAIKPFLDRRMEYKRNPTSINKERAIGLKWVLVSSYGYLRFREFKLGLAAAHMAICAFAREAIIKAMHLAEERGFTVVHGIVDSLYIKKDNITSEDVRKFCQLLELEIGIPISFEGIFKWVVFLPSVNDDVKAVPARYYGVFDHGAIKARGIEVRQKSTPLIVREFQRRVLEMISVCTSVSQIRDFINPLGGLVRQTVASLSKVRASSLQHVLRLSKATYENNIPQRRITQRLKAKGYAVMPGQTIRYVMSKEGAVLPEEYEYNPDTAHYEDLFIRSLFVVLQPFGYTRYEVNQLARKQRQMMLQDYASVV